ncbi:antiterminator Q family protein [Pseudomonas sp. B26(2017)]|uniref:antiterminator Q family protein n=1 Tax=Pseudomonas sp. B26(2017) TaxID=1981732 RepID=UPI000A1F6FFC|nr:antiterminator Q family protein [Pseudomonas sp. B26(2017)]
MKKRTYAGKALGDTEYMLEQWGWWRMDGMGVPSYVSQLDAMIQRNTPSASPAKQYVITDDLALAVDSAVARLVCRDRQMGEFIWLYFGAKWPALRISREFSMGEAKARELIKAGVAWIDCALERIREAA